MSDVVIAPFSNSHIRDWPVDKYAELVGLLLCRLPFDVRIRIVGAPNQKLRACEIVRYFPVARALNECGRHTWREVVTLIKTAGCVISNNSGLGHLGGHFGVPTVCIFGGSHQRHEWHPLGPNVVTISRAIGCSPCQLDHGAISPYGKACLREIEPRLVADAVLMAMERMAAPH